MSGNVCSVTGYDPVANPGQQIHFLKCWPEYFQAVRDEEKTFEIRKDDRGFKVGDLIVLREFDPSIPGKEIKKFTGRQEHVLIRYILPEFTGIAPGYVAMAIDRISPDNEREAAHD